MTNQAHVDDNAYIQSLNKELDEHPELHAASEDWQKIVGMVREAAVRSHRIARMVMHNHQATKRLFGLYLRITRRRYNSQRQISKPSSIASPTFRSPHFSSTRVEAFSSASVCAQMSLTLVSQRAISISACAASVA